jgi:hypothetical protein
MSRQSIIRHVQIPFQSKNRLHAWRYPQCRDPGQLCCSTPTLPIGLLPQKYKLKATPRMRSAASPPNTATAALERLLNIAQRDTGQSRIVANFLWLGGTPASVVGSI